MAFGNSYVQRNARFAKVYDNANIGGDADHSVVCGNARVTDHAVVSGNAMVQRYMILFM